MSRSLASRLLQILRNFLLDIRYQRRFLGGTVPTKFKQLGAQETANSDYDALPQLFAHPAIWEGKRKFSAENAIVDVGCGKGRVINWLLSQGFSGRIIGVELDPDIAQSTSARLRTYANVSIIQADVIQHMPADASVFYLYNPFDRAVIERFKQRVEQTYRDKRVAVIYYNSCHLDAFRGDSAWTIHPVQLENCAAHPSAVLIFGSANQQRSAVKMAG